MMTNSPTATVLKTEQATIEGIQRGLADVKAGQTVRHEVAMVSLRRVIDAVATKKD